MAFYPDELSPIDRIRSLGKQTDSLSDIGPLKNRRQWKTLVLGKKDMGLNNFATIAEEKEEEISSDGSRGAGSDRGVAVSTGAVASRKITFPKPRKYITSRVSDRRDDASLRGAGSPSVPFPSLASTVGESLDSEGDAKRAELPGASAPSRSSVPEAKQSARAGKSKELVAPSQDFLQNYALTETPIEFQWNEAFSDGGGLTGRSRSSAEKINTLKSDAVQGSKSKLEEKKKSGGSSKSSANADRRDAKGGKKKGSPPPKKSPKGREELPSTSAAEDKSKQKTERGKALNMKEVVNVYKNLTYGSKEEIKTFVENLSFVKDESNAESDKNLLSMMNLKALENKIKNFTKKSGKTQEASASREKKPKAEKPIKKSRKAHIERLARHKVVKVPAVPNDRRKISGESTSRRDKVSEQKEKRTSVKNLKDKEPWKYVGMESVLDKTYFVYPAYPPSVNLKNASKARKTCAKGTGMPDKQKKGNADAFASKTSESESKVKGPQVVVKPKSFTGGGTRRRGPSVSGCASVKSANRSSATTVCTVKFRPAVGQKTEEPPVGAADQSLLVYLHGTKAIHVKSPYSDKQFSRVKFFRKDERGMPLIKGIGRKGPPKGYQTVSVRNISLPEKLTRVRSLDLLDFDEDIENITDFLRSQESPDRRRPEDRQGVKKAERERWPMDSPEEQDAVASRHPRRQRRTTQDPRPHPPHDPHRRRVPDETFSPDSIINEISKNIQHLQYLPDTEDNRKMIGQFFDELDLRIEASRNAAFTSFPSPPCCDSFAPIPILGY